MSHDERIQARIDPALKSTAEAIFSKLGISSSEAIRMFYAQVSMRGGIPFDVSIPNAETVKAMQEAKSDKGTTYENTEDMFKSLGL
jgi:DNA-damage-inducible protein J